MGYLSGLRAYRDAVPTMSVRTITSNVNGKKTGNTPDGRKTGNLSRRVRTPCTAAITRACWPRWPRCKLPYGCSQDGISRDLTIVPAVLGPTEEERVANLPGCSTAISPATDTT